MSSNCLFPAAFPIKTLIHFPSTPYVPHAPPILSSLNYSSEKYMVRSTYYEAPHCAFFPSFYFDLIDNTHHIKCKVLLPKREAIFSLKYSLHLSRQF